MFSRRLVTQIQARNHSFIHDGINEIFDIGRKYVRYATGTGIIGAGCMFSQIGGNINIQ